MKIIYTLTLLFLISFSSQAQRNEAERKTINSLLDSWHEAASKADFTKYFSLMTEDAIFLGTDANENWNKKEFEEYAKPYFEKGKAWSFTSLKRNIYFSNDKKTAWFDELLDTQMKICRGSGVLIKVKNHWEIAQYILSISIPNEISNDVIELKTNSDNLLLEELKVKS